METLRIDEVEESLRGLPENHDLFSLKPDMESAVFVFIDGLLSRAQYNLVAAEQADVVLNASDSPSQFARKMRYPQNTIEEQRVALDFLLRGALITHRNSHNLWPNSDVVRAFDEAILTIKNSLAVVERMVQQPAFIGS